MDTNRVPWAMRFEWDERKWLSNLEKHGLDFLDVIEVFEAPHVVASSTYNGREERFLATGVLRGRHVTIVYAIRSKAIRVISFRRARHEERRAYEELHGAGA